MRQAVLVRGAVTREYVLEPRMVTACDRGADQRNLRRVSLRRRFRRGGVPNFPEAIGSDVVPEFSAKRGSGNGLDLFCIGAKLCK